MPFDVAANGPALAALGWGPELAGRARHRADDAAALPVVGDWVTVAGLGDGDGSARITAVLPPG